MLLDAEVPETQNFLDFCIEEGMTREQFFSRTMENHWEGELIGALAKDADDNWLGIFVHVDGHGFFRKGGATSPGVVFLHRDERVPPVTLPVRVLHPRWQEMYLREHKEPDDPPPHTRAQIYGMILREVTLPLLDGHREAGDAARYVHVRWTDGPFHGAERTIALHLLHPRTVYKWDMAYSAAISENEEDYLVSDPKVTIKAYPHHFPIFTPRA